MIFPNFFYSFKLKILRNKIKKMLFFRAYLNIVIEIMKIFANKARNLFLDYLYHI